MRRKKIQLEIELPEMIVKGMKKQTDFTSNWAEFLLLRISESLETDDYFVTFINDIKKDAPSNIEPESITFAIYRHPNLALRMLIRLRAWLVYSVIDILYKYPDSQILSKIRVHLEEYHEENNFMSIGSYIQI